MKLVPLALLASSVQIVVTASAAASAAAAPAAATPATDPGLPGPAEVSPLLRSIADWILTTDVQSNKIVNNKDTLSTSIFINGNLARVLLAAHTIFDHNATYLEAGLEWCDTFVGLQHHQATHDGRVGAAGWWDTGYNELFIADTGTAVTALALCYDLTRDAAAGRASSANVARRPEASRGGIAKEGAGAGSRRIAPPQPQPKRAAAYLDAMLRFADFVVNGTATTPVCDFSPGCAYDPSKNETETTATWLVDKADPAAGPDYGALGDGYYKGFINLMPYTIATATTGGAFFAELSALLATTGEHDVLAKEVHEYARAASTWLLGNVQTNGTIPYFINPPDLTDHTYQCTSYSTEAIVDTDLRGIAPVGDNSTAEAKAAGRMVEYLLSQQQPNGELIGPAGSFGEQQRSPRAVSLLQWWYDRTGDAATAGAVRAYFEFLNNEWHNATSAYGLNEYALVTGFVGLAAADLVQPWCTFSHGMALPL